MSRKKQMIDRTVPEAARILRERHGARAQQVASNRGDDARTESTRYFYERVHNELRKPVKRTQAELEALLEPQKARAGETFTMSRFAARGGFEVTVLEPCNNKSRGHWHCITCDKSFANPIEKGDHFERSTKCRAVWICHEHGAEQP